MIALFILLGLASLVGGIAAIVDGLPYLVLERGFTQVIIGTTLATGGVLLLAMSWLLVELRRVRKALAMHAARGEPTALAPRGEAGLPDHASGAAIPVAIGVAGAAAAAGAVAAETAEGTDDSAPAPQPDLFGSLVAGHVGRDEPASGWVSAATRFPPEAPSLPVPDEAAQDEAPAAPPAVTLPLESVEHSPFSAGAMPVPPPLLEADAHGVPSLEPVPEGDAEAVRPVAPGSHEPEARELAGHELEGHEFDGHELAGHELEGRETEGQEPEGERPERDDEREEGGRHDEESPAEMPAAAGLDDLRLSLEDRLRQLDVTAPAAPGSEPAQAPDELERAGSWMHRPAEIPGQAAAASSEAELAVPVRNWDASVDAEVAWTVAVPSAEERFASMQSEGEGAAGVADRVRDGEAAAAAEEPHPEPAGTVEASEAPAAPEASDEGIVGAYQVGDTYFTIYANGSIQAQTPDGDYSFASMEELKLFLASERNRLGV